MIKIIVVMLLLIPSFCFATDRYVRKTGSDNGNCLIGAPCLTIDAGISSMDAADTLIVGNGVYVNDPITGMPSGTSSTAYTIIKSENVGGAIVDMSAVSASWSDTGINIGDDRSYVQVEGFKVKGNINHCAATVAAISAFITLDYASHALPQQTGSAGKIC